ncbi:MAG: ATPase [Polyangiaceae bacterium]|nr:ATPase [Polyangiaceae bacterium]
MAKAKTKVTPVGSNKAPAQGPTEDKPIEWSDDDVYTLTQKRKEQLAADADALGKDVLSFPGRSRDRVRWSHRIRIAAERDVDNLVKAPFYGEPPLTKEEVLAQRDRIEFFRLRESEHQTARFSQAAAGKEFSELAAEATVAKEGLLRAFDLRFRADPAGQKRLRQIREGEGDADLVQDVSDLLQLASQHATYLASCPRGEAQMVERLEQLSPKLSHLLGAKTLGEEARTARLARDRAFTLVANTERRIRAAAEYWFGGTERMKEYTAYTPPSGSNGYTDDAAPTPNGSASKPPEAGQPTQSGEPTNPPVS